MLVRKALHVGRLIFAGAGCLVALFLVDGFIGASADQDSLLRLLRSGDVERTIASSTEAATRSMLVASSDVILIVKMKFGYPFLPADERSLSTLYEGQVIDVIRQGPPDEILPGEVVRVRRNGGLLELNGHRLLVREEDFPAFRIDYRYVLFLKRVPGTQDYEVQYGSQGAFILSDDNRAYQLSERSGSWNGGNGPSSTPLLQLFTEIDEAAEHSLP